MKIFLKKLHLVVLISAYFLSSITANIEADTVPDTLQHVSVTSQESVASDSSAKQLPKVSTSTIAAEIHSSFSEEVIKSEAFLPDVDIVQDDSSILKNIQVAPQLSETVEGIVFTLVDHAGSELQNRIVSQSQDATATRTNEGNATQNEAEAEELYIVRAEPKTHGKEKEREPGEAEGSQGEDPELVVKQPSNKSESKSSQEEFTKTESTGQHEDMPSFREWSQKQLAEAEKKKVDQNATADRVAKPSGKIRNKNYASPDCGAKIAAANPESVSSSSVLSSSKDEYMLNYCTSRIWFVVELCEAIQAKQLDLANFELFSSSPKHFTVSISSRFPTRDWNTVGKFTAVDSRDIQIFDLNPQLFGKYIKIELHSHYGKEHFCPISWVRVYGTSEFEVLEKEDDRHQQQDDDDDDDEDLTGQRKDTPKNLFSSATDAVLSIVKKATAPFLKSDSNETIFEDPEGSPTESHRCWTPRFITVCDNCSQHFYDNVYYLLSCRQAALSQLIASPVVKNSLISSESCSKYGLDFNSLRPGAPFPMKTTDDRKKNKHYLTALLKESYLAALCNILAVRENKVVVNTSVDDLQTLKNLTEKKDPCDSLSSSVIVPSTTCTVDCTKDGRPSVPKIDYSTSSHLKDLFKPTERFTEKIKPTKTLKPDEVVDLPPSEGYNIEENTKSKIETHSTAIPNAAKVIPTATVTQKTEMVENPEPPPQKEETNSQKVSFVDKKSSEESTESEAEETNNVDTPQDTTLDSILNDLSQLEIVVNSNPASATMPPPMNLPKESIFLRLANRIKNLELNMSLSSSYLEEITRRYRHQLDALAKTVNSTAQRVDEQARLEEERERRREEEMAFIRSQLVNLTRDVGMLLREKNSWRPRASTIGQHVVLVSIELCVVWLVLTFWRRDNRTAEKPPEVVRRLSNKKTKRRNSVEGVTGHESPQRQMVRRPSDEALEIALARDTRLKMKKKRKKKENGRRVSDNVLRRKKSEISNDSYEEVFERCENRDVPKQSETVEMLGLARGMEVATANRFAPISSPALKLSVPTLFNGAPSEPGRRFSSPLFMRTALSSRHARLSQGGDRESSQELTTSSPVLSFPEEMASSQEQPELPNPSKDKKSSGGLKKYMKRFF